MAKKLKDFLKDLSSKIYTSPNPEFDALIGASALQDFDLPDSFITGVESNYLTRERAMNDAFIVDSIQKNSNRTIFNTFDEKMVSYQDLLDPEDVEKIKTATGTYKKFDLLKEAISNLKTKQDGKVNKDANKILEEKNREIGELKKSWEVEKKQIETQMNDLAANSVLKAKALSFNFALPFQALKESIADLTVNNIRGKYSVSLDKGQLKIMQPASEGGTLVEVFEGNEKLTIDKLLAKELKDFTALSNGAAPPTETKATIPNGRSINDMTLPELRQLKAEGVI